MKALLLILFVFNPLLQKDGPISRQDAEDEQYIYAGKYYDKESRNEWVITRLDSGFEMSSADGSEKYYFPKEISFETRLGVYSMVCSTTQPNTKIAFSSKQEHVCDERSPKYVVVELIKDNKAKSCSEVVCRP